MFSRPYTGRIITIDDSGIRHVRADDVPGLFEGLGYCHAVDRGLQMLLMRILGRGQASEYLDSSDEMLAVDEFFRRMNWRDAGETSGLSGEARRVCDAYCAGATRAFAERVPWELKLLGYRPDPWTLEDVLLLSRMAGYVTLAQSQGEMERLLVQWVQADLPRNLLEELFPGHLGGLDEGLVRKVRISDRIVPAALFEGSGAPRMMASNNWVVAGTKTASGKPILSNDPHLEVNRLPAVWYEVVFERPGTYAIGATMPGLPAVIIGRTPELAWGVTYSFMDAIDSWIEDCRDGTCRSHDGTRKPFRVRKEVIRRKKKPDVEKVFYENDHGVLDGDPGTEGFYLATRWSASGSGVESINAFTELLAAGDVPAGMARVGRIETAWNWVLADSGGNIGYQMSGRMPKRREGTTGLVPLPGWEAENDWKGFEEPERLPRCLNPEAGFFATANHDLNAWGQARPLNLPMGPYRADRIARLLSEGASLSKEDMFRIQHDVVSPQAEAFMRILRPLLPETPQGAVLKEWNCAYDPESKGAFLFERVYRELFREVFGRGGLGMGQVDYLLDESGIFIDFYLNFDRVLLSESSAWFGTRSRDDLFRSAASEALKVEPRTWGESRKVVLKHLVFGGKLPRFLGFDRGPVTLKGGRATVHQGQVYRNRGRTTSFAPSFRFVTDFGESLVHSSLCGGPSDRRFSGRYCSELENWAAGKYKVLAPSERA